jgi:ATP-binding protein involved in chromosome partitioning
VKSYHDIATDGGSGVADQVGLQQARLAIRLGRIRHVVAVMSGKGGVGKSVMTVTLACALARAGRRVGVIDADLNGASLVPMTGVRRGTRETLEGVRPARSRDGVEVMSIDLFLEEGRPVEWNAASDGGAHAWRGLVERGALREMLADTAWGELDILLVDLPPGSDKLPSLLDLVPDLAAVVVVTVPSAASAYVVRKSLDIAERMLGGRPVRIIENMGTFVCDACGTGHELFDGGSSRWDESTPVIGRVPFDPRLTRQVDAGRPYLDDETPATAAIRAAAAALWQLVESVHHPVERPA